MQAQPKLPPRLAALVLSIMTAILMQSVAFFYFVAFQGLSPRQMELAGILFLLTAGPLVAVAMAIVLPYRQR